MTTLPGIHVIRAARYNQSKAQAEASLTPDVHEYTKMIPMRDGHMSELRIVEPKQRKGPSPIVRYSLSTYTKQKQIADNNPSMFYIMVVASSTAQTMSSVPLHTS